MMTQDRLQKNILFIGQLLIRISCSFFVGTYLLHHQNTPARHDHHQDNSTETWWTPTQREQTKVDKSVVDQELAALVNEIRTDKEHSAPSLSETDAKQKYAELCSIYRKSCSNTLRDGSYGRAEKYMFQWLSIALFQQIDSRLSATESLQNTLSQLKIYEDSNERRGSAWHTTVKINSEKIPTGREYREVLTHELGHIVDLGVLKGTSSTKNRTFTEFGKIMWAKDDPSIPFYQLSRISESTRKAEASFKDFVSGYAMKWVYEDFAETQNLRFNHNLLFQELAADNPLLAKKYAYFKNLYTNKRFDDNPDTIAYMNKNKRPWDTTRISSE